ncbi:hypothetical protein KC325_g275 [Hortaea werneckii]|nr:hypothetical protein KC325_g275 [Hortaea werneckii]
MDDAILELPQPSLKCLFSPDQGRSIRGRRVRFVEDLESVTIDSIFKSRFGCSDCLFMVIVFLKGTSSIDSVPRDCVSRDPLLGPLTYLRRLGPPIEDDK